jgi:tetratricopeptide (TPR) repeat protein
MTTSVEATFSRELKALRLLVEQTQAGLLAFSLYSDIPTREAAAAWLEEQSTVPVRLIRLSNRSTDLSESIRLLPSSPRLCFLLFDIEAAFPNVLGYVNLHREELLRFGHALVFWIRDEGLRRIAESAPDFWAWRSHVCDFRTSQDLALGPSGIQDAAIGHYSPDQLADQVQALEQSGPSNFVSQLALGRRQRALGHLQKASVELQRAVAEAERQADQRGLAVSLLLLGLVKQEQGFLDEALGLSERSLQIATQFGLNELSVNALGQLSSLAQTIGDLNEAHKLALLMMEKARALDDPNSLARAFRQTGDILVSKRDLRGAIQAYLTALRYEEQLGYQSDMAYTFLRLGRVCHEMGNVSQAEDAFRRAALLFRQEGSQIGEQLAQKNLQSLGLNYP